MVKRIDVPEHFKSIISVRYPPNNAVEYERWFDMQFDGANSDRWYIPVYWCGYQVNHSYGEDHEAMQDLQAFIDTLPTDLRYFTVSQFDNGVGVDLKGKDVLRFDMSKKGDNSYPLPLLGEAVPYNFDNEPQLYFANFVGAITHDIRRGALNLQRFSDYYISTDRHEPESYCRILAQSKFTLCYRGYGINSFRVAEALQYGSIPVVISDEFIEPHNIDINEYGVKIEVKDIGYIDAILRSLSDAEVEEKKKRGKQVYEQGFSYNGCKNKILQYLQLEAQYQNA